MDGTFTNVETKMNFKPVSASAGFIPFRGKSGWLGVGHTHYDFNHQTFEKNWGHHYTHMFFVIDNKFPYQVQKFSKEFCFLSPDLEVSFNIKDCELIQFVMSIFEYEGSVFLSYGANDCTSRIIQLSWNDIYNLF